MKTYTTIRRSGNGWQVELVRDGVVVRSVWTAGSLRDAGKEAAALRGSPARDQTIRSRRTGTITGHVTRRLAGHWTAYSYTSGMGFGPFASESEAVAWVHAHDQAVVGYSR